MSVISGVGSASSSGGLGTGAATGAGIGSVFGPVGAAIGGVVGGVAGLIGSSSGKQNHDHQTNITNQWNSGDKEGAKQYLQSWFDGVGRQQKGHVQGLLDSMHKAVNSGLQADVDAHNAYLNSFLGDIANPIPVELMTYAYGITYLTYNGYNVQQAATDPNLSAVNVDMSSVAPTSFFTPQVLITMGVILLPLGLIGAVLYFIFRKRK